MHETVLAKMRDIIANIKKIEADKEDADRIIAASRAGNSVMIKELIQEMDDLRMRIEALEILAARPHERLEALERGLAEVAQKNG